MVIHWRAIIVLILIGLAMWLGVYRGLYTPTDVYSWIPYFLFTAMFGVILIGWRNQITEALFKKQLTGTLSEAEKKRLNDLSKIAKSNFVGKVAQALSTLTIHYSLKTDTPETLINSPNTVYITKKRITVDEPLGIYTIPAWLNPYIYLGKITTTPHKDDQDLKNYVKKLYQLTSLRSMLPARVLYAEDIGLIIDGDNLRPLQESDREYAPLLEKLKGRKLGNFKIVYLKRLDLRNITDHRMYARRTLLLKNTDTWEAPDYLSELIKNGIIVTPEFSGMHFWEDCYGWSKRNHYTFHPFPPSDDEFIKDL